MKHFTFLMLFLPASAHAQAVRPAPATGPLIVQQPPTYPGLPHAPAGAGASHGSLAAPRPAVERSPNKRVLPASGEPGLWAADGDPVLMAGKIYGWDVLGVRMPVPDVEATEASVFWSRNCAAWIRNTVNGNPVIKRAVTTLAKSERQCLFAGLYHWCLDTKRSEMPEHVEESIYYKHLLATHRVAAAFKDEACNKTTLTERVRSLTPQVQELWKWEPL